NLYGVTQFGGGNAFIHNNAGTVFELIKPSSGSTWTLQTLYSFCPSKIGSGLCPDGNDPLSGLTYAGAAGGSDYDGSSQLFGTTLAGGGPGTSLQGDGVFFALKNNSGT